MTAALSLLSGAAVVGWLVPRLLSRVDLRRRDPLLVLVAWLVSFAAVSAATVGGVVLLLLPGHGPGMPLIALVHRCWSALQHGSPPRVEELAGLLGVSLLLAATVRVAVVAVRGSRKRAVKYRENLAILRLAAGRPDSGVLWLAHDHPLAFSMAGRPGVVVATEGLARHLPGDAVAAVLAHERAHLAGRHHLLVTVAETLRATLPFVPLFRRAPAAVRELVELAADTEAVRRHGWQAVHTALLTVCRHGAPDLSLAMAQSAVGLRLARLRTGPTPPGRLRRTVSCGLTALAAALVPFVAGAGVLLSIALAVCPVTG